MNSKEDNLKMGKKVYENIVDNINVIIIMWDVEGRIKTVNSFAQTLLEYSENELKGEMWIEKLIPQKDKKELYTIFNRAISGEIIKNYENKLVTKSGKVLDVLWDTTIVRDNTGNTSEVISVGTDITIFKAMERNIYDLAYYDSLTNLYNRSKIKKEIEKLIKEKDNLKFALLYIGIALYPSNGYAFYSYEIDEKNLNYINTVNELRRGIENKEFTLLYQPQVDLLKGGIMGVEALIRWNHPKKGVISPEKFIPLAEEIGYIQDISKWVIKTACEQKKQWQEKGISNLKVAINISNNCLNEEHFLKKFEEILEQSNVNKSGIVIEITETAIMHNLEEGIKILDKLRENGIKIALDDFGTGYSSLNYLRKLPIDILKIDKDFIKDIKNEEKSQIILKHIIEIGHALGSEIVAEGIESMQQLFLLKTYGCDIGQGYLFSKPLEVKKVEELLKRF